MIISCNGYDLSNKGEQVNVEVEAMTLQVAESILDEKGIELKRSLTLENYLEPRKIQEFELEIDNSQFIYFAPFKKVLEKLPQLLEAAEKDDYYLWHKLDRMYQSTIKRS